MFGHNKVMVPKNYSAEPAASLKITSIFYTLQGEGPFSGTPCCFIRLTGCNLTCSFCFPSHYPVVTSRGSKKLDKVQIGDKVLTLNDHFKPVWTTVRDTNTRWVPVESMRKIVYKEGQYQRSIICTCDEPFNVKNIGFVEAQDLAPGMKVHHLSANKVVSFLRTHSNPMWDKSTALKVGKKLKAGYASGELVAYKRTLKWRKNQSENLSINNPMYN